MYRLLRWEYFGGERLGQKVLVLVPPGAMVGLAPGGWVFFQANHLPLSVSLAERAERLTAALLLPEKVKLMRILPILLKVKSNKCSAVAAAAKGTRAVCAEIGRIIIGKEVMRVKVLGLVASPRKSGNSEILVKEMLASLPPDVEKEMVRLSGLEIKSCKACYACLSPGSSCVISDDLDFLLLRIKAADAVIIASACYFLGPHTSIKTIGDRLLSVMADGGEFAGKKCITAVTYGIPGWEGYAREAVNNFAKFLHLDLVGDMLVQAANPGEAVRDETLAAARELAGRLLVLGIAARPGGTGHICPDCGSSLLQLSLAGEVRCVMCGAWGKVRPGVAGLEIDFAKDRQARFSAAGMVEHGRLLEEIKQRYISGRSEFFRRRKPYGEYNWWVEPQR